MTARDELVELIIPRIMRQDHAKWAAEDALDGILEAGWRIVKLDYGGFYPLELIDEVTKTTATSQNPDTRPTRP